MMPSKEFPFFEHVPVTDDLIRDLSWFIEGAAYHIGKDCPRREGFEKKLRAFLTERNLVLRKEENGV